MKTLQRPSSPESKVYPKRWATEVHEMFDNKYPNSAAYVKMLFKISDATLISWLMHSESGPRWEGFKKAVKYVCDNYTSIEAHYHGDYLTIDKYFLRVINEQSLVRWAPVLDSPFQQLLF